MFYRLHIIEYLTTSNESNSEEEKEWVLRFISEKGYEKLTEILFGFIGSICVCQTRITKEIVELLIDLLQPFLMSCFATH